MPTVVRYSIQWKPSANTGDIYLVLEDGKTVEVHVNSAVEFIAVALVLDKLPVTLFDDGTLDYTSPL